MVKTIKKIHFIGIGGSGMNGLAEVYAQLGYQISGSDISENDMTQRLQEMGVIIFNTHDGANVKNSDLVIVSSAIRKDNPEWIKAIQLGIPVWHRSELLMDLMNTRQVIAVSGTHGKTTTSSMIFSMLLHAGVEPTAIIGGKVKEIASGAFLGDGPWLVAEADESDKSFLKYSPHIAVITNIESDHLEHYDGNIDNIIRAFREFMKNVPVGGWVIFGIDDQHAYELSRECYQRNLTYGFHPDAQIRAENIQLSNFNSICDIYMDNNLLGKLKLHLPGKHNIKNALASISVAIALELPFDKISLGLEKFGGVERRFQIIGNPQNIIIVDDYAHNPTKVAAAISAAKTGNATRVIAIFQPHRYTRTKFLYQQFGQSFHNADLTILTEIYPAGERAIPGVSAKNIYDSAIEHGYKNMVYIPIRDKIIDYLLPIVKSGDLVLFMGAGDIWKIANKFQQELEQTPDLEKYENNGLKINGNIQKDISMQKYTLLRVGGRADMFITAESIDDLKQICDYSQKNKLPIFVIGLGSNLIVRDDGIDGIVIKLGKGFAYSEQIGETQLRCGSAARLPQIIRYSAELDLTGMEELAGIPASIGGALAMNAGAHGKSMSDVLESVKVMTFNGEIKILHKKDIQFGYHSSDLTSMIIIESIINLNSGSKNEIIKRIQHYLAIRSAKQPVNMPSAGCIFRNPVSGSAGELIERAGLKGTRIGDALISPKHANFFVNTGNAEAKDFLNLIELARKKVKNKFDIDLDLEVKIIGRSKSISK